jgi:hypothetical protein
MPPRPQLTAAPRARDLAGYQPGLDRRGVGLYHLHVGAPRIDEEEAAPAVQDRTYGVAFSPFRTSNILTAADSVVIIDAGMPPGVVTMSVGSGHYVIKTSGAQHLPMSSRWMHEL